MTKGGGSGKGGSGGKGGGSSKGGGSGKSSSPMSKSAASRIQSVGDRNPESKTAQSGFAQRAQSAADRAENTQQQQTDN
jgi:hypothetical protein